MLLLRPASTIAEFEAIIRGDNFSSYLNIIKTIPSRKWDAENLVWTISIHDYEILLKECQSRRLSTIDIEPSLHITLQQYKQWKSDLKSLADSKDCEISIDPAMLKMPLMPHQKVAIKFALDRKCFINGYDTGLGKTLCALVTAKHLHDTKIIKNCLIVCIASVKYNWVKEIDKFFNDASYTVIEGTKAQREELYKSPNLFKIINYESLKNDINTIMPEEVYDCIIVDEIHRIKTYNTKQTKTLYKLGKTAKYKIGLTGTPIQNKLRDLHSIMRFINPSILSDWFHFEQRYVVKGYYGEVVSYRRLDEIHNKLHQVLIRKMKADVLEDLPPKVYSDIYLEMGVAQKRFYKQVLNNLLESLREDVEEKIKQANTLAQLIYLRETCDSCELIDPSVKVSAKIDELKEVVSELLENGHKIVIFSQFEKMTQIIEREIKYPSIRFHGGISTTGDARELLIQEFHTSKEKNIFIMTTAGGEGINLQCADVVIFFDIHYNPAVMYQVVSRCHRLGQKNSVNVIRLIIRDTVEDRMLEIIKAKESLAKEVLEGASVLTQKELLASALGSVSSVFLAR